jgi:DNA invertase Pin-like site-specific DNA recombinase
MEGKFVSYLRVSTRRQGASGLGLEAQREAVARYLNGGGWKLVEEFTEEESGKSSDNRPKLAEALAACYVYGATLVVARLDRLSRNASFLMQLKDSGMCFVAADMPDANNMTIGIMALVAQNGRETISANTKAALAVARVKLAAKGKKLGAPRPNKNLSTADRKKGGAASGAARSSAALRHAIALAPRIKALRANGITSMLGIAKALNDQDVPTPRRRRQLERSGAAADAAQNYQWTAAAVKRILARLPKAPEEKGAA